MEMAPDCQYSFSGLQEPPYKRFLCIKWLIKQKDHNIIEPMKRISQVFYTVVALALLSTLCAGEERLLQSGGRTALVAKMCGDNVNRSNLIDTQSQTQLTANSNALNSLFKIQGNTIVNTILTGNNLVGNAVAQVQLIVSPLVQFVGPFIVGLVINLLIWPFLCCCCCCPTCCPSACCRKPEAQQYTKCQRFWPSIVLIVALLLVIVPSVIGITRAGDIEKSYKVVGCSFAIAFDDIINGNVSSTNKFFIGLDPLVTSLRGLQNNIATVNTNMDSLRYGNAGGVLRSAYDVGVTLIDDIKKVPTNTADQPMPGFTYNNFDGTAGTTPSTFPTVLGQTGASASGLVNGVYTALNSINQDGLKAIGDAAQTFYGQFSSSTSAIDSIVNSVGGVKDTAVSLNTTFNNLDDAISDIMKIVTIVVTAIFGVFIGFGVLSVIGTLLMTFCDKFKCRYLVYFVCFFFTILGILSFLLTVLFSILSPVLFFGCQFLTFSISSPTNFSSSFSFLGSTANNLKVCFPGGDGDFLASLGVDISGINSLKTVVDNLRIFNATALLSVSDTAINTLTDTINQYYFSDLVDFSHTGNSNFMTKVSDPTQYGACSGTAAFVADSWVPSIRNSAFPCAISGGATATVTAGQCAANSDVSGRTAGCRICMDTNKIMYSTSPVAIKADVTGRYSCGPWTTDFDLLYDRYYAIKKPLYDPIKSRADAAKTSYNTGGSGYKAKINAIQTTFDNTITTLSSTVNSVVDPSRGLIAGLNCQLLGQDFNLIANTVCAKLFNVFMFLRIALGLVAFGILFSLCCGTCAGVRAFKHSERVGSIIPGENSNLQQESTIGAFNAKEKY